MDADVHTANRTILKCAGARNKCPELMLIVTDELMQKYITRWSD